MKKSYHFLFAIIFVLITGLLNAQDTLFTRPVYYPVHIGPVSLFAGDIDNDFDNDLIVVTYDSGNAEIFKNQGDGTFAHTNTFATGSNPSFVVGTDFNDDDNIDLVVCNRSSDNISIYFNNSDGTFQNQINYATGNDPFYVTTSDVDNDDDFDIIVSHFSGAEIAVLKNDGHGDFSNIAHYYLPYTCYGVITTDIENDGDPDIIVANAESDRLTIMKNDGTGVFGNFTYLDAGDGVWSVSSDDFDNDGDPDLAVTNANAASISILENNGSGVFTITHTYAADNWPNTVISVDLNNDNIKDLAVTNGNSDNMSIYLGNGDGSFQNAEYFAVGDRPAAIVSSDLNGDSMNDIITVNYFADSLAILFNNLISTPPNVWHIAIDGSDETGDGSEVNPFATIQHGINFAANRDTVLVYPGTYTEHINFSGKAIVVKSEFGPESTTITSDIAMGLPLVHFNSGENAFSEFKGFTVTGNPDSPGIKCSSSSPTIIGNIISQNVGPGIYLEYSDAFVDSNILTMNEASRGGGVFATQCASMILSRNSIYGNTAAEYGAGICADSCAGSIVKNQIYQNTSEQYCGGLYVTSSTNLNDTLTIVNNTLSRNIVNNTPRGDLTIYSAFHRIIIKNNIIGFSDGYGLYVYNSNRVYNYYNDIWNNTLANYYGILPGMGAISDNPQFIDINNNNYELGSTSPCIDTGDPSSPLDPDGTRADMGAIFYNQSYRINVFNLIQPEDQAVVIYPTEEFIWHSTTDTDSGYAVFYKHYLDDNSQFNSPIIGTELTDTAYTLPDTLTRSVRYYWRIEAYNNHASPIYSDETWMFYLDGYPSTPTILTPESGDIADGDTYLIWLVGTDPDSMDNLTYTLQVDNNDDFSSPEIDISGLSATSLQLLDNALAIRLGDLEGFDSLIETQIYYWHVKSDDAFGLSSPYTDGGDYFIYGTDINNAPLPPISGFSPANNEEIISLTPTITWNGAVDPDPEDNPGTLHYCFHLIEDSSIGGFEYYDTTNPGINQVSIEEEIPDNSHYFYFVKTVDTDGLESDWSESQSFWTNHYNYPPEPFPLIEPGPDSRRVEYYTYFNWGNTIDYDPEASFNFTLQISSDSLFENIIINSTSLTDTSLIVVTDSLTPAGGDYFWRVFATDNDSLTRFGGLPEPEVRELTILPAGDANADGNLIGSDVTYLVAYFRGLNPAPDPPFAGDANGDCSIIGSDVTYLVQYFRGINPRPMRSNCEEIIALTEKIDGGK